MKNLSINVTLLMFLGFAAPGCGDVSPNQDDIDVSDTYDATSRFDTSVTDESSVDLAGSDSHLTDPGRSDHADKDLSFTDEGSDSGADIPADATYDAGDEKWLPVALPFTVERQDVGTPIPAADVTAFTQRLVGFWKKTGYFEYLRDTSFGMHESTGMRDFQMWWTSIGTFTRQGDTVIFGSPAGNETGGGHNMMTRSSKILAGVISGHLLTGLFVMAPIVEQYCKGVTSTMLGMVKDESDDVNWLMARNVVPPNHSYTLDDGRKVEVDMDGWHAPYDSWNCSRFKYDDNPEWGEVWVTNMRSKDDVSRLLKSVSYMRYVIERTTDEDVRAACTESYELVKKFSADVVDSGYCIRTKGADGTVFCPGSDDDPVPDKKAERGDLASYVQWEDMVPDAECKSKLAHALIGYDDPKGNDCPQEAWNVYEQFAVVGHYFNIWIIRSYHLSATLQSLIHRHWNLAERMVRALVSRYDTDMSTEGSDYQVGQDEWDRDLASSMMQAAAVGHPTSWDQARLIHKYVDRAIERTKDWPYWNPWADDLADGTYPYRPADYDDMGTEDKADDERWVRPEDMATIMEVCWSPFRNPADVAWVDCDLVANPDRWDVSWAD